MTPGNHKGKAGTRKLWRSPDKPQTLASLGGMRWEGTQGLKREGRGESRHSPKLSDVGCCHPLLTIWACHLPSPPSFLPFPFLFLEYPSSRIQLFLPTSIPSFLLSQPPFLNYCHSPTPLASLLFFIPFSLYLSFPFRSDSLRIFAFQFYLWERSLRKIFVYNERWSLKARSPVSVPSCEEIEAGEV